MIKKRLTRNIAKIGLEVIITTMSHTVYVQHTLVLEYDNRQME